MLFPTRNSLFDDFFTDKVNHMSTDVRESENGYLIDMNVPGYAKEDLHMDLKNGYLTVSAVRESNDEKKDQDGRVIRQERYSGKVSRSFYVGEINQDEVKASYNNGVLSIFVPKQQAVETKKYITIQ